MFFATLTNTVDSSESAGFNSLPITAAASNETTSDIKQAEKVRVQFGYMLLVMNFQVVMILRFEF